MTKTKYTDQKTRQLLDLALRYGFTCRKLSDNLSTICAKNTDGECVSWIVYDRSEDDLSVRGNTDKMNIWLSDTRPDSKVATTPTSEYNVIIKEPMASGWPRTLTTKSGMNARQP